MNWRQDVTTLIHLVKAVFGAMFMVVPLHLACVLTLFFIDVSLGVWGQRRRGEAGGIRQYAHHVGHRMINIAAWLAVVLIVTNMEPGLKSVQSWLMFATALTLAGRIVRDHLTDEDLRGIWDEAIERISGKRG